MRNLKLGLFSMLCAVFMFGITTAFDINVGPENYYGTLTLNRVNIMKSYGLTGIVLDGTGYIIKIGENASADTGAIRVRQICDRSGNNCKLISQLSTSTPVMNSINDDGLVEKTNGEANKVRKTDTEGKPQWLDDADTHYTNTLTINGGGTQAVKFTQDNNAILNITGGSNTSVSTNGNTITISSNDSDTHYTHALTINGSGTQAIKFSQDSSKTLNIKGSGNVSVSVNSSTNSADIIITSTGGGGTSLRQTSGADFIKPRSTSYNIVVGDNKLMLKGNGGRYNYSYCPENPVVNTYVPMIQYNDYMIIRSNGQFSCADGYIQISNAGLGIGAPTSTSYKLVVGGAASMNSVSASSITASSANIGSHFFTNNKVGININPSTRPETLQVNGTIRANGSITIGNNRNGTSCTDGTIDFTGGRFYGCIGGQRKKFMIAGDCANCLQN